MGLIGPLQAFAEPTLSLSGAAAQAGDQVAGATEFASVFAGLAGQPGKGLALGLQGELPPGLVPDADVVPDAPKAKKSDDGTPSANLVALLATLPVAVDLPEAAAEHSNGLAGVRAAGSDAAETLDAVIAFLEQAAAEADDAEAPEDPGIAEMLTTVEDTAAPGEAATVDGASEAAAQVETDVPLALGPDPVAMVDDGESAPAGDIQQLSAPDQPPSDAPAARTLDITEAPPDAPPDSKPVDATSVVRPVGNAPATTNAAPAASPTTVAPVEPAGKSKPGADDDGDTIDGPDGVQPAQTTAHEALEAPATQATESPSEPIRMEGRTLEQVADAVVERLDKDGGEARLTLDPPDLGEIVIKLHARGEHVHVEVIAQRADSLQVLRDGSPSLQALLQHRGLDLSTAQFTLSQQGQHDGGQQSGGQQPTNDASGFAGLLGFDEPGDAANRNHNRLRAAYNPDGALFYRV